MTEITEPPFSGPALDVMQEVFFAFTPEGKVLQWNRRVREVTGYTDEEIAEMHPTDFVPSEEEEFVRQEIATVLEEGQTRFESWLQAKGGETVPCEFTGSLLKRNGRTLICGTGREITRRKEAEKKLAASEKRYRRLFEEAQEGIAVTTPEGEFLDVNPVAEEILGYSVEELQSIKAKDLYADPKQRKMIAAELKEEGALQSRELRFRHANGKEIVCEVWSTLIRGPDRRPEAYLNYFQEVTERKEAQAALKKSEELHRAVLANLTDTVFITDEEGRFTYVCPNVHFIFGYSAEEVLAQGDIQALLPKLVPDPERIKEVGEINNLECRVTDKEGQEHVLLVNARQVEIEQGSVLYSCRDITERKRAEEALQESEETFRTLAENTPIGIGLVRGDSHVYVNPVFSRITGRELEELKDRPPEVIFHPEDRPSARRHLKERLEGEKDTAHYQARVQTKSGETRYVEICGTRINHQGEPAIIGTVQDITERRRLQQEVLQIQEEERRRIGQDLHDSVASQLTGANLKLNMLSQKAEGAFSGEESSGKEPSGKEEVAEEIEEVQKLIKESASDVRRLSRGLNPAGLSEGDLLSALKGLVANTEGARLKTAAKDENLLPLDEETATPLYRIAQEATRNAQKYAEASEIEIRLRQEDGTLALEVEDDGEGFDLKKIKAEEGLGLRSMRHRAELLGANFTIESSPGEGTLVRCRLPI